MVTAPTTPTGTLPVAPPNHSVEVLTRIETPTPGNAVRVIVKGRVVAVFNAGNRLYASDAKCGHRQRPQEIGGVRDGIVTCPRHYAQFRLDNG
jgi:nitrite reductase/ring-hydroxylating ferredoxin subunit